VRSWTASADEKKTTTKPKRKPVRDPHRANEMTRARSRFVTQSGSRLTSNVSATALTAGSVGETDADFLDDVRRWALVRGGNVTQLCDQPLFSHALVGELFEMALQQLLWTAPNELEPALSIANTLLLMRDAASALDYMHTRSPPILFRNLTQTKMYVYRAPAQEDGPEADTLIWRCKIGGFTESIELGADEAEVRTGGRQPWGANCAPELFDRSQPPSVQADVYSLGRIMEDAIATVASAYRDAQQEHEEEDPSEEEPNDGAIDEQCDSEVDRWMRCTRDAFAELCARCTARSPTERPSSSDVFEALGLLADSLNSDRHCPPSTMPPSSLQQQS
jgi:hypothetical protein